MTDFNAADAIPRDRWGRPMIVPADGGKPVAYTRVSTLAKVLDDKTALTRWKQRQTAIGMSMRPDLVAKAGAKRDDKRTVDEVVEEAMVAASSSAASSPNVISLPALRHSRYSDVAVNSTSDDELSAVSHES